MTIAKDTFNTGNVVKLTGSSIRKTALYLVVKGHFIDNKNSEYSGFLYFITDENGDHKSEEMRQSWSMLDMWSRVFNNVKVIGTYDFENNVIKR